MDDPIFIPIEQLEQKGGEPEEFTEVIAAMKAGLTGHVKIERAQRGKAKVNHSVASLTRRVVRKFVYSFLHLPDFSSLNRMNTLPERITMLV